EQGKACARRAGNPGDARLSVHQRSGHRSIRFALVMLTVRAAQCVPVDVPAHLSPELSACFLIEAKMDSAIHTRVIDVARDLLEGVILQDHTDNRRVAQRDEMMTRAVESLEYFSSRTTSAGVR